MLHEIDWQLLCNLNNDQNMVESFMTLQDQRCYHSVKHEA